LGSWFRRAVVLSGALLGACNSSVVHEQVFPAEAWGTGQSQSALRVRVDASGTDCTLGCLAQSRAVSDAVGGIMEEQVRRELAGRQLAASTSAAAARGTVRELDAEMVTLEKQSAGAASDADLLRALNMVCMGLGAPQAFTNVADARAFLDRATTP
jgi:hypothetical protein